MLPLQDSQVAKNWIPIDATNLKKVTDLCQSGHYVRLSHSEIPAFVPQSLTAKCPGAVLMASGLTSERTVYVLNLIRDDNQNLDENPVVFVSDSGNQGASGYVYQHGDWINRTSRKPTEMQELINVSGMLAAGAIGSCAASGILADLKGLSHIEAFHAAARQYFQQTGAWPA